VTSRSRATLGALLLLLPLLAMPACDDDDLAGIPPLGQATLNLQLVTTLEPGADQTGFSDLDHVFVTWSEVRLDREGSQDVVLTPTEEFDLLDHVDTPADLYGPIDIPAGSYRALSWVDSLHEMVGPGAGEECQVVVAGGASGDYVIRDSQGNPEPLRAEDGGTYTLLIDTVTTRLDCTTGWLRDPNATEVRKQ
jgi:hypothetical protein